MMGLLVTGTSVMLLLLPTVHDRFKPETEAAVRFWPSSIISCRMCSVAGDAGKDCCCCCFRCFRSPDVELLACCCCCCFCLPLLVL